MNAILTIQKYKKIKSAIFEDFATVNWLVGKNGSGKTSVINAVSHLNDGVNAKTFCSEGSHVELTYQEKSRKIKWQPAAINPNHTSDEGNLRIAIIQTNTGGTEMGANNVTTQEFRYHAMTKETHEFINESCNLLGMPITEAKRDHAPEPWTTTPVRTTFFEPDEREVDLQYLASGLKAFNNLRWTFEPLKRVEGDVDLIILLLEEPENNLHPNLQKQIPKYFEIILSTLPAGTLEKLICIISTHSPFILGGVSDFQTHKVYPMADGSMIDLDMQPISKCSGYASYKCSQIVGQMLGGDVTDLGYPENFILLEEVSMQIILEAAKEKDLLKNFTFISASGVTNAVKFSETFKELSRLNTLLKCNPFYCSKYKVILDNRAKLPPEQKKIVERFAKQEYNPLVELAKSDIEEYYPNLSQSIYDQYIVDFFEVNGDYKEVGKVKRKYAEQISSQISSPSDFSKLFENELDFLLRPVE